MLKHPQALSIEARVNGLSTKQLKDTSLRELSQP